MSLNYYIADVFTDTAFSGAQIAVFPEVGESLNEASMLNISKELNLSETVFVKSLGESAYEMRVFFTKR
jgi:trans-2,3-dihydro-3-hydroxyanthranilate isomerase